MTPQVKIIVYIIVLIGINVTNSRKIHDLEELTKNDKNYEVEQNNAMVLNVSTDSLEALEPKEGTESKESERKLHKREQRTSMLHSQSHQTPKANSHSTFIEAPYPNEAAYPKEVPYPVFPAMSLSTDRENSLLKRVIEPNTKTGSPTLPFVADDIEIRRAIPFENDYISRHYTSKFQYPPEILSPGISNVPDQKVISLPFYNSPEFNSNSWSGNENGGFSPQQYIYKMYPPFSKRVRVQSPPSSFSTPSFFSNVADELNRFRNPFSIPQVQTSETLIPSSPADYEVNFSVDPTRYIPWVPSEYENLQQFSPLDRLAPENLFAAQPPSIGFNMEVSEIAEPAFIVPENVGKVNVIIPPPFAPLRTHGLTINDAQITRNEVRKDNGEFLSSFTTSDGTTRIESGSLVPTADGDEVLVLKGSYSFTSPEGLKFRVDYTADENGFHATQIPVSENDERS